MANLSDNKIGKKLKKAEKEKIPTLEEIEEENKALLKKESQFRKKFFKNK